MVNQLISNYTKNIQAVVIQKEVSKVPTFTMSS